MKKQIILLIVFLLASVTACGDSDTDQKAAPTRTVQPITPVAELPQVISEAGLTLRLPDGWVADLSMAQNQLIAFYNSQSLMDQLGSIGTAINNVFNNIQQSLENPNATPDPTSEGDPLAGQNDVVLGIVMIVPSDVEDSARTPEELLRTTFSTPGTGFAVGDITPITSGGYPGAHTTIHSTGGAHPMTAVVNLVDHGAHYVLSMMFAYQDDYERYRPTFEAIQNSIQVQSDAVFPESTPEVVPLFGDTPEPS